MSKADLRELRFTIKHMAAQSHAHYSYDEFSRMTSDEVLWELERLKKFQKELEESYKKQEKR